MPDTTPVAPTPCTLWHTLGSPALPLVSSSGLALHGIGLAVAPPKPYGDLFDCPGLHGGLHGLVERLTGRVEVAFSGCIP